MHLHTKKNRCDYRRKEDKNFWRQRMLKIQVAGFGDNYQNVTGFCYICNGKHYDKNWNEVKKEKNGLWSRVTKKRKVRKTSNKSR